jgi:hypothetical protein
VLNRAATALRQGALTLLKSQTYLGAQYRRLRKLFAPKAITAMAHRLARLVYRKLKYGQQYVDNSWYVAMLCFLAFSCVLHVHLAWYLGGTRVGLTSGFASTMSDFSGYLIRVCYRLNA